MSDVKQSERVTERQAAYRSIIQSAPVEQRERLERLFGILKQLNDAGIDVSAGYRLENPFARSHTPTVVRSGIQAQQGIWTDGD